MVQDAIIGKHEDVQKLLAKHGGKPFKELSANLKATEARAEDDRRAAITDILHFASTGEIRRMQVLCDAHSIKVGPELSTHMPQELMHAASVGSTRYHRELL